MSSIRSGAFDPGASGSALRPHNEAGSSPLSTGSLSVGDSFSAQPPSSERPTERFPVRYPAKGSLGAVDKISVLARVGIGASLIIGASSAFERLGHRAALLRSVGGLGFAASLAALWAAGHMAAWCLAGANKALELAMKAGCEARYLGWPSAPMNRDDTHSIRCTPRGSLPAFVATNELGLKAPARVVVEQCPKARVTVIAMAHSADEEAATRVAGNVARGTQQAVAALDRADDPYQVRAAIKHAIHMPELPQYYRRIGPTDVGEDAVAEVTAIVMHGSGPVAVGHVGRARALLCEDGKARALTLKHTLDTPSEQARLRGDADPRIHAEANLSRALVQPRPGDNYKPARAQVTFAPGARHSDAAIVLLSPELASKVHDDEVAELLKGVAYDSAEASGLVADLVSLGRARGGTRGLVAAVALCGSDQPIDYSNVVARRPRVGPGARSALPPRRPPVLLKPKARNPVSTPLTNDAPGR